MYLSTELAYDLGTLGAIAGFTLSALGTCFGCGKAGASAVGSWKKCFVANKPAPFQLLILAGAPFSQTIYGLILLFSITGQISNEITQFGACQHPVAYLIMGILAGAAIGFSSYFQGIAAAGACDAQADTGKGFALYLLVLGVIETVAIFVMVFIIVILSQIDGADKAKLQKNADSATPAAITQPVK